jgi:hypothetical protein
MTEPLSIAEILRQLAAVGLSQNDISRLAHVPPHAVMRLKRHQPVADPGYETRITALHRRYRQLSPSLTGKP